MREACWRHAAALAFYAAISAVFIGHGAPLTRGVFGTGSDPLQFVWFLSWFPYAISHHQSLFYTHLLWQPLGVPLFWVSSIPLPCMVLIPATMLLGPVVVYNLMILAAPVLSAFCAFLLCRRFSGFMGALLGGYVFGFSSYEMAADLATPNLSLTFLLPCLVLLALRRLAGEAGRKTAVLAATFMLVAQFLISIEVFATTVFFGALTWALAVRMLPALRAKLVELLADAALAAGLSLLILSPLLVEMFRHFHYVNIPKIWPFYFVTDPLNLIVPTHLTWLGGAMFAPVAKHFPGILQEQDAYIGLPMLLILAGFARARISGFLVAAWAMFAIASLGPRLWLCGTFIGAWLPWAVFLPLPLISSALPVRFALFVSLAGAVMVAIYLEQESASFVEKKEAKKLLLLRPSWFQRPWPQDKSFLRRRPARAFFSKKRVLSFLVFLSLLPAPHLWMKLPTSTFFAPGEVQRVLGPNPRLLVLPFGPHGASIFWQQENQFGFTQAGGYLGFPPRAMQQYKAVGEMFGGAGPPNIADLQTFLAATGTHIIVAGPGTSPAFLAALPWPRRQVDDVTIFTVPNHA